MDSDATPRPLSNPTIATALAAIVGGRYQIERQIGEGGMATVYRAMDLKHQRIVALKVMRSEVYDAVGGQRFLREVTIAAQLTHPHIVPLHDSGEVDGMLFYVMPYIDGPSLRAKLLSAGQLPVADVVRILRDVADALGAAHALGVVHRDIKPENIMLLGRSALVADFGIAKALTSVANGNAGGALTATGVTAGTPAYMAPEQIAADPGIDQRADLYALGVVAYETLTGATPFSGRTPTQLAAAIMIEEPPSVTAGRPDLPPALAALVSRLLAKEASARPSSAAEVVDALDALDLSSSGIAGRAALRPPASRRRRIVTGVFVTLAIAGAVYAMRSRAGAAAIGAQDSSGTAGAAGTEKSVVVLPFTNDNGDSTNVHFAVGLTVEIADALRQVPGLSVMQGESVVTLKSKGLSPREIADALHATALMQGSVRSDGDRIRVTVALTRAKDDSTLWHGRYNAQRKDVFTVQADIADSIATAVHARAAASPRVEVAGRSTTDFIAHDLFLRGNHDTGSRDSVTMARGVAELVEATHRDPAYALAYVALADAYVRQSTYGFAPLPVMLPLAEAAADEAIRLAPQLGEAFSSKGFALVQGRKFPEAERAFLRAIQLTPNYFYAHHYYSLLLSMQGREKDALRENLAAVTLEPFATQPLGMRGIIYLSLGSRAEARHALETAVANAPDQISHEYLGLVDAVEGHFDAAATHLQFAMKRASRFQGVRSGLVYVFAHLGRTKEADSLATSIREGGAPNLQEHALLEAVTGNVDAAYRLLDFGRAVPGLNAVPFVINIRSNPLLAAFRGDARYPAFLQAMGVDP